MLWYGVTGLGLSLNGADPADVMLNTGSAAPLLSDHPRPLIAAPNEQNHLAFTDQATAVQHGQMLYDPNTGDYVNHAEFLPQGDYIYENYDGYDDDSSNGQARMHVLQHDPNAPKIEYDDESLSLPKTKKPKVHHHPALKLKTPIAYQKDTDLNAIPIMKEGMAVCCKCGAIGVKHAFYGKERKYCSLSCARPQVSQSSSQLMNYELHGENLPFNEMCLQYQQEKPVQKVIGQQVVTSVQNVSHLSQSTSNSYLTSTANELPDFSKKMTTNKPSQIVRPQIAPAPPQYHPSVESSVDLTETFDWSQYLKCKDFLAAPVTCFNHVPMSECWEQMTPGMKVEVSCGDEGCTKDAFWVAAVIQLAGYKAKLRFEGFIDDESKDFWVDLCSEEIHPVGWCATLGKPLIPPRCIQHKHKDWKEFLMKRLTGARTLPTNFMTRVIESQKSRFRPGHNLEVVDKNRIAQMRVATVVEIVGKRLHLKYHGAPPDDDGFWCHEDAPIIHPVGWSRDVGHEIVASMSYHEKCTRHTYDENDATSDLFIAPPLPTIQNKNGKLKFEQGMKLEAIDPLNLATICVATVMKVLKNNYLMIRIDSYENDDTCSDWFCYHCSSPCIFPAGFCEMNNITMTIPKGYEGEFTWYSYLKSTQLIVAPPGLFNLDVLHHGLEAGMSLESSDLMDPRLVCVAKVQEVKGRLLKIHFDGWETEFDQWIDCQSPDLYPVGWCNMVGYKLEGPRILLPPAVNIKRRMRGRPARKGKLPGRRTLGFSQTTSSSTPTLTPKPNHPNIIKNRRGRPPKLKHTVMTSEGYLSFENNSENENTDINRSTKVKEVVKVKGKRGRPRKDRSFNQGCEFVNNSISQSVEEKPLVPQEDFLKKEDDDDDEDQKSINDDNMYIDMDDNISDDTSSGVASLAGSETSRDAWDMEYKTTESQNSSDVITSSSMTENLYNPSSNDFDSSQQTSLPDSINPSIDELLNGSSKTVNQPPLKLNNSTLVKQENKTVHYESQPMSHVQLQQQIVMSQLPIQTQKQYNQLGSEVKMETQSFGANRSATNLMKDRSNSLQFESQQISHIQLQQPIVMPPLPIQTQQSSNLSLSEEYFNNYSVQTQNTNYTEYNQTVDCDPYKMNDDLNLQVTNNVFTELPITPTKSGEASNNETYIPRVIDGPVKFGSRVKPKTWTCQDVSTFLNTNDCGAYCNHFLTKNIDGNKLLQLSQNDVMDLTGMKVGPSLKIQNLIQQLLALVNPAQARYQATLMKRGLSFGKT